MKSIMISICLLSFSVSKGQEIMSRLVQLGDSITFRKSALINEQNRININWRQQGKTKKADYIQTAAKFTTDGEEVFVVLFIQESLIAELIDSCNDKISTTCKVRVNSDYQYGQDKKQTNRFLVFHDKSYKPYQHRFVTTATASKFMTGAEDISEKAGDAIERKIPFTATSVKAFKELAGLGKGYLGEFLHDF